MSEVLNVRHKEGKLRIKPSFLGRIISKVPYGTDVTVIGEKNSWLEVQAGSRKGWMHKASLTEKEIVIKAGDKEVDSSVSDDELVLAGKGFNEDVERSYRKKKPALNYTLVDRMESFEIRSGRLAAFIEEGDLPNV